MQLLFSYMLIYPSIPLFTHMRLMFSHMRIYPSIPLFTHMQLMLSHMRILPSAARSSHRAEADAARECRVYAGGLGEEAGSAGGDAQLFARLFVQVGRTLK